MNSSAGCRATSAVIYSCQLCRLCFLGFGKKTLYVHIYMERGGLNFRCNPVSFTTGQVAPRLAVAYPPALPPQTGIWHALVRTGSLFWCACSWHSSAGQTFPLSCCIPPSTAYIWHPRWPRRRIKQPHVRTEQLFVLCEGLYCCGAGQTFHLSCCNPPSTACLWQD